MEHYIFVTSMVSRLLLKPNKDWRVSNAHCTFLLKMLLQCKKTDCYSLKEVNSDWICVLGLLTLLQGHWNPRLPSVIDWIISSWHWNDLECLMLLLVFLCLALCQKNKTPTLCRFSEHNQVGASHRGSPFKETLTPFISDLSAMTLWPHITINNGV